MRREERLSKTAQFAAVFKHGKTRADTFIVLRAMPNGLEFNRFGFIASKKVGKAVVRNRIRRLLREVVRLTPIESGWDIVLIARNKAADARYRDIKPSIMRLLGRAGLLGER